MASYNFDDAYNTDSFTDSDWEAICDHVGVDVTNSEDENVDKEKGNKESFDGKTESNSEREKIKENEEQNLQDGKENEEQNLQDGNESQPSEADNIDELRRDMKDMRKTLKKGRVQLLNWEETNVEDLVQTYKNFKQDSKKIKKKFKALLYSSSEESGNTVEGDDKRENIPVEASGSGSKGVNISTDDIDTSSPAKPIFWTFQGSHRYRCPYCDYSGRSMGKTYSHMVVEHNAKSLGCNKCSFTTKNPTSLHNHRKLYCGKKTN